MNPTTADPFVPSLHEKKARARVGMANRRHSEYARKRAIRRVMESPESLRRMAAEIEAALEEDRNPT